MQPNFLASAPVGTDTNRMSRSHNNNTPNKRQHATTIQHRTISPATSIDLSGRLSTPPTV